jgi:tripartite-type tricarboxylate transporter receptor subunit TctC
MSRAASACALACAVWLWPIASEVQAQANYPTRPVKIIVPSEPAGGTDMTARILAQEFSQSMGQQFVIENRPGAAQMIGIEAVARSTPDGYTLLVTASPITIIPSTHRSVRYDVLRDFAPISQVVTLPAVLVVNPQLPIHSLADFIATAKQRPEQLTYASAGTGSQPHMAMELLKSMAGINIQQIPYKGVAPALTDVLAGRVSTMIVSMLPARAHIDAGGLRALAVTGLKRANATPNLPTISEAGLPTYEALQWFGFLAPAGTPAAVIDRLHAATARALRSPDVVQRFAAGGAEPVGNTPAEFAMVLKDELEKWARVARAAGIEPQ